MQRRRFAMITAMIVAASGSTFLGHCAKAQIEADYTAARRRLVDEDIIAAGIRDPLVIDAIATTLRHEFMPPDVRHFAYYDMAVPIGESQTISPPYIVAFMTEQLEPQRDDVVLEIGTGSGYQAAVLSPLVREVYSIEIVEPLGKRAAQTLKRLGYQNVHTKVGDGYQGWPEHAPFDKIIVTCSPESVPQALVDQLQEGGRMIIPLGERYQQVLYLFKKENGELVREALRPTLFVPMTGAAEERREKQPDPTKPGVVNGSFEDLTGEPPSPTAWHYQRQLEVVDAETSPAGKRYAQFRNVVPGRPAQCIQGFAVDGREVRSLDVSLSVRAQEVKFGNNPDELAGLVVTYYDQDRAPIGNTWMGPWRGSFDWRRISRRMLVPANAREAIIRVGLFGSTGELSVDGIELGATTRPSERLPLAPKTF